MAALLCFLVNPGELTTLTHVNVHINGPEVITHAETCAIIKPLQMYMLEQRGPWRASDHLFVVRLLAVCMKLGSLSRKIIVDLYVCMLSPSGGDADARLPPEETNGCCLHI